MFCFCCRSFVSRVVEVVLQVETPEKSHIQLVQAVNENYEMDSEFWKKFSADSIKIGCDSGLKESGRFLELLVKNSDDKRATAFRQMARKDFDLIKENFAKYLPVVAASLSKKFSTSIKTKAAENLCKQIIVEILNQKPEEITEEMSSFVGEVSVTYKCPVDLEDYFPVTGENPSKFKIIFDLVKNSPSKNETIVNHILLHSLEIVPKLLKELSKNDESLTKSSIMAFCALTSDCIESIDKNCDLLKEKISKKKKETWQNFVRACLKHGLKLKLPQVVGLLSNFCRKIYEEKNSTEIGQIYDMVCGHSSFVDTVLSTSNKEFDISLRENVLELVLTLIRCKKSLIR